MSGFTHVQSRVFSRRTQLSVIPLIPGDTVVTTEQEFEAAGGRGGSALLIRGFDTTQLHGGSSNLSYDLRVGGEYKDHRDGWIERMSDEGHITLLPGSAVIIETEESLHVPGAMFGYIVPRVKWLQQGISNTLSKVDAGYNGRLLVTLFNLGKNTVVFPRRERFCSLVVHSVAEGVLLYEGEAKRLLGPDRSSSRSFLKKVRDRLEANPATVHGVLIVATVALAIVELLHLFWK